MWFDKDNNFMPPEAVLETPDANVQITAVNSLRLALAAEFLRCKVYGRAGIDSAIDDADTALGFLNRTGVVVFRGTQEPLAPKTVKKTESDRRCSCGDYCYGTNWACGPNFNL